MDNNTSKVGLLWFNFSKSYSHPDGPVNSGLSLRTAELAEKETGQHRHRISRFGEKDLTFTVTNRRDTYLNIQDIRTPDGTSAIDPLINVSLLYRLLIESITEHYQTFDFGNRNMAVLIDKGEFDDLKILKEFRVKLAEFYLFDAPIDMTEVAQDDEQDIPFFMTPLATGELFKWVASVCPSLLSTFSFS